jgi:SPP1 gp7 family putative phage head morphogenesis protein
MRLSVKPAGVMPKEALEYFRKKKLAPDLDLAEVWGEEHDLAFTVAGVADEDLLAELQRAIDKAIEKGVTFREFANQLDEVLVTLGWARPDKASPPRRLKTVYETNMRVARAAGQWDRITRTAENGRAYLEYSLGPAVHHRPEHEAWAGTVLRYDDAWWSSHFPPNGYGCKCRVRQISDREAERKGISEAAPAGEPDPGWERNPGASRGA